MPSQTIQQLDNARGVASATEQPPPLRDRVRASLHHRPLDRRIADGEPVTGDRRLEVRAWQLTRPDTLRQLADSIERVVRDSRAPRTERDAAAAACHEEVRVARGELLRLAARLQSPAPVHAEGVARVAILLSDGRGPLFLAQGRHTLWRTVRAAIEALD